MTKEGTASTSVADNDIKNDASVGLINDIVDQLDAKHPEKKTSDKGSGDAETGTVDGSSTTPTDDNNTLTSSMMAPLPAPGAIRVSTAGRVRVTEDTNMVEDSTEFVDVERSVDNPGSTTVASSSNGPETATTTSLTKDFSSKIDQHDVVSANVVDEDELEAAFQARMKAQMVEATEVKPHELESSNGKDHGPPPPAYQKHRWIALGFLLAAVVVVIVVPVMITRDQKEESSPPPPPVSTQEYLTQLFLPASGDTLLQNGTAQNQALNWMTFDDSYTQNHLNSTNTTADDDWVLEERYAMATLYYSTGGDTWSDDLRFLSNLSICEWPNIGEIEEGAATDNEVDCKEDPTNKRVVKLRIERNNLTGTVPPELMLLSELEILTLGGNSGLVGTMPPELSQLEFLNFLQFSGCKLNGTLPEEMAQMTNLVTIGMYNNDFSGTLPAGMINSWSLERLDFGANKLTGTIPDAFVTQSQLQRVYLDDNDLSGTFPSTLYAQPRLEELWILGNRLSGTIAQQVRGLTELKSMRLDGNQFSGTIPIELGELENVEQIVLSGNKLNGTLPSNLGRLLKLSRLDVSGNLLWGPLPSELSNAQSLQSLSVADNIEINGTVPITFGELEALSSFDLANTSISDGLEQAFCNQSQLITSIEADCGGDEAASINCSCCTTCCDPTADDGDCEISVPSICRTKAGLFESADGRGAQCTCSESEDMMNTELSCSDTTCESCLLDESNCANNTDYGYVLNGTSGDILSFSNTISYSPGSEWEGTNLVFAAAEIPEFGDGQCAVYVNGTKCRSCSNIRCQSGFRGFRVFCDNLDEVYNFNSCDEGLDSGYLSILFTYDASMVSGCPLILERV